MRLSENTIVAVVAFAALFVVLGIEGTWLVADPVSAAFAWRDPPAHSDAMWNMLRRAH